MLAKKKFFRKYVQYNIISLFRKTCVEIISVGNTFITPLMMSVTSTSSNIDVTFWLYNKNIFKQG